MNKIFVVIFIFTVSGCGPGTSTGNPLEPVNVNLRLEDKQPFAWFQRALDQLISPAYSATSNVKFCFKIAKFKPDAASTGSDFELVVGQVNIDPNGTNLLTVAIPPGTYQQIDFELDKDCDGTIGKPSVSFTNNNGPFFTDESMTIKFQGIYTATAAGTLTLNLDPLLDSLELVTMNNQIKINMEAALGDF